MRVGCGCRRPVKQGSFLGCDVGQEGGGREGGRRTAGCLVDLVLVAGGVWSTVWRGGAREGRGAVGPALLATRSSFRDLDEG